MVEKIKRQLKTNKHKYLRILFFVVFFSVSPLIIEYYVHKFSPPTYWFEYHAVRAQSTVEGKDNLSIKTIQMTSYADIKRAVEIQWIDTLYCTRGEGFIFVDSQESSNYFEKGVVLPRVTLDPITNEEKNSLWEFSTNKPLYKGAECYIRSSITAVLPSNIRKVQIIESNHFIVI